MRTIQFSTIGNSVGIILAHAFLKKMGIQSGDYLTPEMCRSASRASSEPSWMGQDAQLPKSLWYLTDAHWLGFRLVRPLSIPTAEEMFQIWNSGNVHDK